MVSDVKKKLDAGLISSMAERSPRELIRLSEKRYREQIAEVADRFASTVPQSRKLSCSPVPPAPVKQPLPTTSIQNWKNAAFIPFPCRWTISFSTGTGHR